MSVVDAGDAQVATETARERLRFYQASRDRRQHRINWDGKRCSGWRSVGFHCNGGGFGSGIAVTSRVTTAWSSLCICHHRLLTDIMAQNVRGRRNEIECFDVDNTHNVMTLDKPHCRPPILTKAKKPRRSTNLSVLRDQTRELLTRSDCKAELQSRHRRT